MSATTNFQCGWCFINKRCIKLESILSGCPDYSCFSFVSEIKWSELFLWARVQKEGWWEKHEEVSACFEIPKYLKTVVPFAVPVSIGEKNATKREEEDLLN